MIIASEGMELFVADFSKIEVATGWWLSDNGVGLRILKLGGDPYKRLAAMNTNKKYEEIGDDSEDRQLAKHQVLGCQYGMGWEKFQRTGWDLHRLKLSDDLSKFAVRQYRQTFPAVPVFWRTIEKAAIEAVRRPGRRVRFPHGAFVYENKYLWMVLPSGRKIAYREPQIAMRMSDWGEQETLEFWAVNSRTKKWNLERTWGGVLFENLTQGVSRDLLIYALPRLERRGYQTLFTVHDEVVSEREKGRGSLEEFIQILCERPAWGDEKLLLEAKGYVNERYRK